MLSEPATASGDATLDGYTPASIGTQVITDALRRLSRRTSPWGSGSAPVVLLSSGSSGSGGSGGSGTSIGIAFSCIVDVIDQTTDAYINSGAQINTLVGTAGYPTAASDESVTVSATQTTTILDLAGAVSLAKNSGGTGAGVGAGST